MSIIAAVDEANADQNLAATFGRIKDRYGGFLPEIYKVMGDRVHRGRAHRVRFLRPRPHARTEATRLRR